RHDQRNPAACARLSPTHHRPHRTHRRLVAGTSWDHRGAGRAQHRARRKARTRPHAWTCRLCRGARPGTGLGPNSANETSRPKTINSSPQKRRSGRKPMLDTPAKTEAPGTEQELTDGFHLVIDALKLNDVKTIYGVPGIPITDFGRMAQASGI